MVRARVTGGTCLTRALGLASIYNAQTTVTDDDLFRIPANLFLSVSIEPAFYTAYHQGEAYTF